MRRTERVEEGLGFNDLQKGLAEAFPPALTAVCRDSWELVSKRTRVAAGQIYSGGGNSG